MFRRIDKDRLFIIALWTILPTAAWSLPVIDLIATERERAKVESGHYYQPKMPVEWYVQDAG